MRRVNKTFVFVSICAVISLLCVMEHESYCEQEMELIGGGGQSRIYKCGSDVVKLYRRPWEFSSSEMKQKLLALNRLSFVAETKQFYKTGIRQEQLNGTNGSGLSKELHFMLGQQLAQIHQTKIEQPLTASTACHSNTAKVYDHLTMSTATWVLNCAISDGNPPPGSFFDKVMAEAGIDKLYLQKLEDNIHQYKRSYLCHNDVHYKNLVQTKKGLKIIDFDHANFGYRGYDLAYWLQHSGFRLIKDFLTWKNSKMDELIKGYISITGEDFTNIYTEICTFLPYTILDHMLGKKPELENWIEVFKLSKNCTAPRKS